MPRVQVEGWESPFSEPAIDQTAIRAKRRRIGIIALAVIALFAFAWGWNPPTKNVHTFSAASNYKPDREAGCTNSGKGCHGRETSYSDFNDYHPNAKCTTCHDFQGVGCIPCHMPSENECPACHDGSLKQAQDVARLSRPSPRGHYSVTKHFSAGTKMTEPVTGAVGGKASAPCESCHSQDLADAHTDVAAAPGSTYGTTVGCGECHNDVRTNGLAQVLSKWKTQKCSDCHATNSAAPQHGVSAVTSVDATSPLSCGATGAGCHDVNDLHAIHKDKPKTCAGSAQKGEKGCHVIGAEATKPNAITCGGISAGACHQLYVNGTYSHKRDTKVHSPKTTQPADDTSFWSTPCGGCHQMAPDGTSLVTEHALPTSARSDDPDNVCTNCHNNEASVPIVDDKWSQRDTPESCSACHGASGLPAAHVGDLPAQHDSASPGCAGSGAGCHPTSDLLEVGKPTPAKNIHRDCLRCHDWTQSNGDFAYDPTKKTCGEGRDCHGSPGAYDPTTDVHDGSGGLANGNDTKHHKAGKKQARALWKDSASGTETQCKACHNMKMGVEHTRPNSDIAHGAGTVCTRCHNANLTSASVVKNSWPKKNKSSACASCHTPNSSMEIHGSMKKSHVAVELAPNGTPTPGACVTAGCHATLDLRVLHASKGCMPSGCHVKSGNIFGSDIRSCGGLNPNTGCHPGFSANQHFQSHAAGMSGTHEGVTYSVGQNVGCFGCHLADLQDEHQNAMLAGQLNGGGAGTCAICHSTVSGAGSYAGLSAVKGAIAGHDKRCSTCHASGSKHDGPSAVASAHKDTSTANPLPPGKVWSDPAEDWKTAFDAPTGSGHNVLPSSLVGGATSKNFPLTEFSIEGTTYTWALPPNSGPTAWLKASEFPPGSTQTTESIKHISILCSDCHNLTEAMRGPHGSAVPIAIDPAYSQSEYANPTRDASQFEATGTDRVVCFKCHQIYSGGIEGTTTPGGAALHARHVTHPDLSPSSPHYYGEACVDCHVRIPHAWRRPRLLIRTVVTTDGATPDAVPYILPGHNGLLGIVLKSFDPQTDLRSRYCVTGGCHPASSPTRHPHPSDVPTATYWP